MIKIEIDKILLFNTFGNLDKFALEVLDNLSYCKLADFYDLEKCIWKAVDDALLYVEDRWALIEYYSTPEEPYDIETAIQVFVEDFLSLCKNIIIVYED